MKGGGWIPGKDRQQLDMPWEGGWYWLNPILGHSSGKLCFVLTMPCSRPRLGCIGGKLWVQAPLRQTPCCGSWVDHCTSLTFNFFLKEWKTKQVFWMCCALWYSYWFLFSLPPPLGLCLTSKVSEEYLTSCSFRFSALTVPAVGNLVLNVSWLL